MPISPSASLGAQGLRCRTFAAGLAAATIAACGIGEEPPTLQTLVTDSGGIRHVVNEGGTRVLALQEVLRVGQVGGDPNFLFNQVRGIAVDDEASIWVADASETIRGYSDDGSYLGAIGGSGDGPGESRDGWGHLLVSDSAILATSYSSGTFQLFTKDGQYLGSRSVFADDRSPLGLLGSTDGGWLFRRDGFPSREERHVRERWTVYNATATDAALEEIASFEGRPLVATRPGAWAGGSFFDGYPSLASDRDGRLYYTHPREYRIDVLSESGALNERIERRVPCRPYASKLEGEIEEGLRDGYRSLSAQVNEEQIRDMLESAVPVSDPDCLPTLDEILVSDDGSFWVRRADQHPRPAMRAVASAFGYVTWAWLEEWRADWVFDLFGADGQYRGTAVLPLDFTAMVVVGSRVYGVLRDELGVEYVVAYEAVVTE